MRSPWLDRLGSFSLNKTGRVSIRKSDPFCVTTGCAVAPTFSEPATFLTKFCICRSCGMQAGFATLECFRQRWENVTWVNGRFGTLLVTHGKTKAARRVLPMTPRVRAILVHGGKPQESRQRDGRGQR